MYKAILFDLDGTLIDNYSHWDKANRDFFASIGLPAHFYNDAFLAKVNGVSMIESVRIMKEHFRLKNSVDELLHLKTKFTDDIYSELAEPMPGATDLLERVKQKSIKTAIASGSPLERIKTIVQRFGWEIYFDELASVEHVQNIGKPDPAVFLYAAKALKTEPNACVVIEDAANGVRAAKAAGMVCAAVASHDYDDFSLADRRFYSLADTELHAFLDLSYV